MQTSASRQLVHRYTPRGACAQLFRCRDAEVLLSGPAGTGKSRGCLEKLHLQAMKYPGMRGLIVRKTLVSLGSTTLVTWRSHVIRQALQTGEVEFYGGSQEEPAQYRYRNGSAVVIGGMDKPTKIMSSEYDVAYAGEAIELTVEDWEAITTRLRNGVMPYQQLIADTNPDKDIHWLIRRCQEGTTTLLESRHEDNPIYVNSDGSYTEKGLAYIVGKLDRLTGVRLLRLRHGKWVSAEGVIYAEFDRSIHLVDKFDPPPDWARYWAVDFGYKNPFVLACWAVDPDGRLWLYREIYMTRRLVEDHAQQILSLVRKPRDPDADPSHVDWRNPDLWVWTEPRPVAIVCDHDAEDRATLERHIDQATTAAHKGVSDGIQGVSERLRPAPTGSGRMVPRLLIMRDCLVELDQDLVERLLPTCTAEEWTGYIWANKTKEEPVKENDHGLDQTRYIVAELDFGTAGTVRWL
jgi:phage terminase large subunit